jgi:hypothetical protein
MTEFDYYQAPSQEVFEDIKKNAIEIWKTYDDEHKYATNKINRIKDLENVSGNAWYIVAMFDCINQVRLISKCKKETADLIIKARGY